MLAVLATCIGKFIFMDWLQWRLLFVSVAITGWTAYVLYRNRKTPGILVHWGFRRDNFSAVARIVLPFALLAGALMLAIGLLQGSINLTWHMLPLLITYPVWGTIQQFLVVGLVAGNIQDMPRLKLARPAVIFITAALFSVVHYTDRWLMMGTLLLALFYGHVYLRQRNRPLS